MSDKQLSDRISVIIPVYNVEEYLRKCIESVLNQSYRDLEVILIDDGSTDGSKNIIDEYKSKDSRIICLHKKNGGLSSARNAGLDIATGDYIVFVDGDDFILSDTIAYLHEMIALYDVDIAGVGCTREERQLIGINTNAKPLLITGLECASSLVEDTHIYPYHVWGKIYRRKLLEQIRFPINHNMEDIYYSILASVNARSIAYDQNSVMSFYRLRDGSITTSHIKLKHSFDFYYIWKITYDEIKEYVEIKAKCARRVVRSFIHLTGKVYGTNDVDNLAEYKWATKDVDVYYNAALLCPFERVSYKICRYAPRLIGLLFSIKNRNIEKA